ncbi:DinB family protein [Allomuricauda sp. CP2A]|jgi:uncharacterized damage-inducible protein DinB|uniref:DinB family protein n=1 Tax=Allomuricauda sp. CP2A TaxID=1848189 RepID=UPI0009F52840|nr:DinB family protein [Muricauda sp. CP2A]
MKNCSILKRLGLVFFFTLVTQLQAQDMKLPYHEIPDYPETYTAGNVAARMIDGLGYRYYWASEGLTQNDLEYKPSEEGRSSLETLRHIYGLTINIVNATTATPNTRMDLSAFSYEELRQKTLENLKTTSDNLLGESSQNLEEFNIIFQRGDQQTVLPFWNLINGMISDAIYHTGQIVLMRRTSGNPQNPNVNVLLGKTRE